MTAKKKTTTKPTQKKTASKAKRKSKAKTKSKTKGKTRKRKSATIVEPVTFKSDFGKKIEIPQGPDMRKLVMRWRYTLARRFRWQSESEGDMEQAAFKDIVELIPAEKITEVLRGAKLVEIQVPYENKKDGWEGRAAPWEFLATATAAGLNHTEPFTITRWLQSGTKTPPKTFKPKMLYVQLTPGKLATLHKSETLRELLGSVSPGELKECINPTLSELRSMIGEFQPNIIHLAGVDNYQARNFLSDLGEPAEDWAGTGIPDGAAFASDDLASEFGFELIPADDLAKVLNCADEPLQLLTSSLYYSASCICPFAVAGGAGLAIGFQDTVSAELTEAFFRDFYTHWQTSADTLPAFNGALQVAKSAASLSGSGVVLWNSRSLLKKDVGETLGKASAVREQKRSQVLGEAEAETLQDWFHVHVDVRDSLNYSALHNDSGGLFEDFSISKDLVGSLHFVRVEVVLYQGAENHAYQTTFTMKDELRQFKDKVKIPLTSLTMRTVSEPLRTSLLVRVSVGDRMAHEETYRVTLLPADEWKDNETDGVWLPSFVLPRDPAVSSIIDRAQKHLVTLTDDIQSGFDGYQSYDPNKKEPDAGVDLQVQAIWATVVNDYGIRYINPPPSYSFEGQRLRTPTQVIEGGRGTCIDLALLLAACLEYVDIFPVLVLLNDHAFAGYWRNEARYYEFLAAQQDGVDVGGDRGTAGGAQEHAAWMLPSGYYEEVLNEVEQGSLCLIETVDFATHGSLKKAMEQGAVNLGDRTGFHSVVDVRLSRVESVTPLPVIDAG